MEDLPWLGGGDDSLPGGPGSEAAEVATLAMGGDNSREFSAAAQSAGALPWLMAVAAAATGECLASRSLGGQESGPQRRDLCLAQEGPRPSAAWCISRASQGELR